MKLPADLLGVSLEQSSNRLSRKMIVTCKRTELGLLTTRNKKIRYGGFFVCTLLSNKVQQRLSNRYSNVYALRTNLTDRKKVGMILIQDFYIFRYTLYEVIPGPCKMITPVVDKLAEEYAGKVKVVKVNVDEGGDLAGQMDVMGVPSLIFFQNGEEVKRIVGNRPDELKAAFAEYAK